MKNRPHRPDDLPATAVEERRRHPRSPAPHYAVLHDARGAVAAMGRTENLSQSGCLLVFQGDQNTVIVAQDYTVSISMAAGHGGGTRALRRSCHVVRATRRNDGEIELGLEFTD